MFNNSNIKNYNLSIRNTVGQEVLGKYINLDDAIKKFAIANGIDTQGLIKTSEQIQQDLQQQQSQQFAQSLQDPRVLTEAGKALSNSGQQIEVETEQQ